MSESSEIDLTKKICVITDDEKFKSGIKKWLPNGDFNLLGNILNGIDDMGDKIVLNKIDDLDLQFSCKNINGDEYTIFLLDKEEGRMRYFLAFSNKGDGLYSLLFNNGKIFISSLHFDNDEFNSFNNNKSKKGNFALKKSILKNSIA